MARPYEDSSLEVFQLLVSGLEFHLDDWLGGQTVVAVGEAGEHQMGLKQGHKRSYGGGFNKHLQELPNAVVFASGLPPKTNPSSGVISTTPL